MIIAAERTLIGGRAEAGLGIAIDRQGVIERIAPLAALDEPSLLWPGELLVPGRVDVFAPELSTLARAVLAGLQPSHALTGAIQQHRARGTTTVGVPGPYSERGHPCASRQADLFAEADILIAAAQATDIRLAFLDRIATDRVSLDDALSGFEQLVRHLMGYRDPRLSWALWATPGPALPMDALTGLRVRLGHLPCFIELTAGSSASTVQELAQLRLLDACTTVISPEPLNDPTLETLLRLGVSVGIEASNLPRALARASGTVGNAYVLMTGPTKPERLSSQPGRLPKQVDPTTVSTQAFVQAIATAGSRALGLQAGGLTRGAWADAYTLPLETLGAGLVAASSACPIEDRLVASAIQHPAWQQARRCLVGGVATLAQH